MTFRVITQALLEFKCEWCGDVEQVRAPLKGGLPEGWYRLAAPFHPSVSSDPPWQQLCVLCGMHATSALSTVRGKRMGV